MFFKNKWCAHVTYIIFLNEILANDIRLYNLLNLCNCVLCLETYSLKSFTGIMIQQELAGLKFH